MRQILTTLSGDNMTPRLIELFKEYESGHRHPTNQLTHKVAIPVILFHIIAMLDWIHLGGHSL
jgi:uncharacterized membrane protein YGL010W